MRKVLFFLSVVSLISCKAEFDKIRESNNTIKILDYAHKEYAKGDYTDAISMYEFVLPSLKGTADYDSAFCNYAMAHYLSNDYLLASTYLDDYAKTFSNSTKREEMLFLSAMSIYNMSPRIDLDQSYTAESIQKFQHFLNIFPQTTKKEEINRLMDKARLKLEEKSFKIGLLYYNLKRFDAAIQSFENTLQEFPDSKRVEEIRYLIVKSHEEWAKHSIYSKIKERYIETIDKSKLFLRKFADSKHSLEIKSIIEKSQFEINKFNS